MAGDDKATWKTALYVALVAVGFIGGVIGLTQLTISADDPGVQWHASLPLPPGETPRGATVNGVLTYETWVGRGVALVAVGFIGSVIGLTQLTISADDPGVQWHASLPLLPGETLRVETVNGVITYETWDGSEVEIEATARARALTNGQARRYTEQVQ